jgi:hypothetical protein
MERRPEIRLRPSSCVQTPDKSGYRTSARCPSRLRYTLGLSQRSSRYGAPTLVRPRLGQGAFRVIVIEVYDRRCTITGERTLPVLEAAHIKPYVSGGPHPPENGLLLRSDLHTLSSMLDTSESTPHYWRNAMSSRVSTQCGMKLGHTSPPVSSVKLIIR